MLRGVDTTLKLVSWFFVAFFVTLLFVGPQVIAEDRPDAEDAKAVAAARDGGAGGGGQASPQLDGKALFSDNCGSCHTLSAAGTSGSVGPNLDDVGLDAATIEGIVRDGRGAMPTFGDKLSADEISAIAQFVAGN
jgi:mono/diheme cytochrome c family protein